MWIQKDKSTKDINWNEVVDWVVIDGVLWIDIPGEKETGACIVQR